MKITKQLRTETGHRLVNYDGRCAHLHGHSYLWEVTLESEINVETGMVADFKDLKAAMHEVLDPLDHCMVLSINDPMVEQCRIDDGTLDWELLRDNFRATNGADPRLCVWHENPTAESFAKWAAKELRELFIIETIVQVRVWETATSYADWTL